MALLRTSPRTAAFALLLVSPAFACSSGSFTAFDAGSSSSGGSSSGSSHDAGSHDTGSSHADAASSSGEASAATPDATTSPPDATQPSNDAAPPSMDGGGTTPTPDATAPAEDASTPVPDATTPPPEDSSVTTPKDATAPKDASTPKDAHPPTFPDAGAAVMACQSCLSSTCGTDVTECLEDPSCEAAIDCTITSGCLAIDAGGIEACVDSCIKNQGLTPHETAMLVQEITALSTCATPCLSKCGASDAGH